MGRLHRPRLASLCLIAACSSETERLGESREIVVRGNFLELSVAGQVGDAPWRALEIEGSATNHDSQIARLQLGSENRYGLAILSRTNHILQVFRSTFEERKEWTIPLKHGPLAKGQVIGVPDDQFAIVSVTDSSREEVRDGGFETSAKSRTYDVIGLALDSTEVVGEQRLIPTSIAALRDLEGDHDDLVLNLGPPASPMIEKPWPLEPDQQDRWVDFATPHGARIGFGDREGWWLPQLDFMPGDCFCFVTTNRELDFTPHVEQCVIANEDVEAPALDSSSLPPPEPVSFSVHEGAIRISGLVYSAPPGSPTVTGYNTSFGGWSAAPDTYFWYVSVSVGSLGGAADVELPSFGALESWPSALTPNPGSVVSAAVAVLMSSTVTQDSCPRRLDSSSRIVSGLRIMGL